MRLISIDEYNPVLMQLARPIYDKERRVLLSAGRKIHPVYLERLAQMDIRYIFVEDAVAFGITLEEMIDFPKWLDAIDVVKEVYKAVEDNEEPPIRELQKQAITLVDEVAKRKAIVLVPTTALAEELRRYAHSVNVTLLSLQMAKKLELTQIQLKDLAIGALLHDIGKVLTKEEDEHPTVGFEYLRKMKEVSLLAAHVAYQHHESFDGSGKPRGLVEKQIHEFAQICSICNTYEHLLSIEGLPPHTAHEYIMTKSGTQFSPHLVKILVQQIPSYIPGTIVKLSNGRKGIVTRIYGNIQRPYIRYLDTNEEISLADHLTILISEVLAEEPTEDMINNKDS